mmetsp:Transcript_31627/g.122440  ORF Transcript_31627/g.122440 Transcript_31627/m.122440 type:complete len:162 (-) Transcript_31627:651-1136(-)
MRGPCQGRLARSGGCRPRSRPKFWYHWLDPIALGREFSNIWLMAVGKCSSRGTEKSTRGCCFLYVLRPYVFDRRIVKDFSSVLHKSHGNVEESRMAQLGGEFAMISLVSIRPSELADFRSELKGIFSDSSLAMRYRSRTKSQKNPAVSISVLNHKIFLPHA